MIVQFEYNFWGSNGRDYDRRMEEYENLQQVIDDLGPTAYNIALNEDVNILRVVDGGDVTEEMITNAIAEYVKARQKKDKLEQARNTVKYHENFLANMQDEIIKRTAQLQEAKENLAQLEADCG